jgi:hypothetical protein
MPEQETSAMPGSVGLQQGQQLHYILDSHPASFAESAYALQEHQPRSAP